MIRVRRGRRSKHCARGEGRGEGCKSKVCFGCGISEGVLVVYEGISFLIIVLTTVFVFVRYQSTIRDLDKTLARYRAMMDAFFSFLFYFH